MNIHQYIAIGAWAAVVMVAFYWLVQGLGQLVGFRNLFWLLVAGLIYRVGPFLLIGYTIWAFWAK